MADARLKVLDAGNDIYFSTKEVEETTDEDDEREDIIVLNNIHKTYLLGVEGVPALRGVSLTIKRGDFVCVYGTSGGGKTSLLNIIGTIDKPTKGELFINGTRIDYSTPDRVLSQIRLNDIGFVFQTFNLLSSLTALENVELPMILAGTMSASERTKRAIDSLTLVGMKDRLDHMPSQLSGGEQQRVTIARSISNQPSILLLDEPTGDLDTVNSAIVMKLLTDLNIKEKKTLVMVTHDIGLKYFADRIIWLRDGKIQRIEIVSKEKKQETLNQLYDNLHKLGVSPDLFDSGEVSHQPRASFETAHNTASSSSNQAVPAEASFSFSHSTIRMPTDYQTNEKFDSSKSHAKFDTFAHMSDSGDIQLEIQ